MEIKRFDVNITLSRMFIILLFFDSKAFELK